MLQYVDIAEMSFKLDLLINKARIKSSVDGHHVFVCGLARAGTTILMSSLFETRQFSSLTYRDMPFILAPNLWSKFVAVSRISMAKEMRQHGDDILIDYDSPEALEEVFWRIFTGDSYIFEHNLSAYKVETEAIKKFQDYISLILLRYKGARYLSKNNNNVLRIDGILEAFPHATILIPFRDPIQQAYSLMNQHINFSKKGIDDPFITKYMVWLSHHEFGLDHRPFNFGRSKELCLNIDSIDYWLQIWFEVYRSLFDLYQYHSKKIIFVCYEDLCLSSDQVFTALEHALEIPGKNTHKLSSKIKPSPNLSSSDLLDQAYVTYSKLREHSRVALGI